MALRSSVRYIYIQSLGIIQNELQVRYEKQIKVRLKIFESMSRKKKKFVKCIKSCSRVLSF